MTAITNMVVALMIVTQAEEPVKALPLDWTVSNMQLCTMVEPMQVPTVATGSIETLYRKTFKTNFVYSCDVDQSRLKVPCDCLGCNDYHNFTIDELFGSPLMGVYFSFPDKVYCKKHEGLKELNDGH